MNCQQPNTIKDGDAQLHLQSLNPILLCLYLQEIRGRGESVSLPSDKAGIAFIILTLNTSSVPRVCGECAHPLLLCTSVKVKLSHVAASWQTNQHAIQQTCLLINEVMDSFASSKTTNSICCQDRIYSKRSDIRLS